MTREEALAYVVARAEEWKLLDGLRPTREMQFLQIFDPGVMVLTKLMVRGMIVRHWCDGMANCEGEHEFTWREIEKACDKACEEAIHEELKQRLYADFRAEEAAAKGDAA